jgi:hypothetical protein
VTQHGSQVTQDGSEEPTAGMVTHAWVSPFILLLNERKKKKKKQCVGILVIL